MNIWPYIAALIPSAGVGFLFYLVIKNMIEGDRKERLAHSQWDAAHPENGDNSPPAEPVDNSR
ncbi:hypothetical protein GCM10009867_15910 [Pedococcus aerophilus]|uniref:Lysyl-tRNA synthetase n=1 Tax=Pedococcus aerophilus TaxID=436356 RepID=A0ABN3UL18_9MICO